MIKNIHDSLSFCIVEVESFLLTHTGAGCKLSAIKHKEHIFYYISKYGRVL